MKNHTKIYGFSFLVTFFFCTFANMKKTVLFLLAVACVQMLSGQTIVSNGKYIPLDTLKNRSDRGNTVLLILQHVDALVFRHFVFYSNKHTVRIFYL